MDGIMICKVSFCALLVLRKAYVRACAHWIWYNNESTCNFIGTQVLIFLGSQTNSPCTAPLQSFTVEFQKDFELWIAFPLHETQNIRATHLRTDLNR